MPQRQVIKGKALMADERAKSNQSHSVMARDGSSFTVLCPLEKPLSLFESLLRRKKSNNILDVYNSFL